MALSLAIGSVMLSGAALAASPVVSHQRFEFTHEATDTNICGDWGVFRFSGTDTFTVVAFRDGVFHVNLIERATNTLTFLDEPQETWDSRFTAPVAQSSSRPPTAELCRPDRECRL